MEEFINAVIHKWGQHNCPKLYTPYKEGDYVFIYGECTGLVIYPCEDEQLNYTFLEEDDEYYFYYPNLNPVKNVGWLKSEIKCINAALKYLKENATPLYYIGDDGNEGSQCGWKLPWKN